MFQVSLKKVLIGGLILVAVAVPLIFRSIATQQLSKTTTTSKVTNRPSASPGLSPIDQIRQLSEQPGTNQTASNSGLLPNLSFGPTLNLKIVVEGRPADKQGLKKVFVGLAQGQLASPPKYLLTFTIDFPDTGLYSGLSLAGLDPGQTYTAYIKGPGQLATSSAFTMAPDQTNLNGATPLTLLSGDLNDDNVINSADYSLAKSLYGTNSKSPNWNERADFNLDGIINTLDLSYIIKNFGKTGASGVWVSPIPPPATKSGTLNLPTNIGGVSTSSSSGHWLWIPDI